MMDNSRVRVGRVLKYVPAYNYYTVQVEEAGALYSGVMASGGSGLAGTRVNPGLTPNSLVLIYVPDKTQSSELVCYILGAVTPVTTDQSLVQTDHDAPQTRAGFYQDAVLNYPTADNPGRDLAVNANNQTSRDALPGEYTIQNPIGPALHVGHFWSQLKASDRAAIQCFREGDLVRVLGREYQLHTGMEETQHSTAEGELNLTRRVAMLPWEALGSFTQDQAPAQLVEPDPENPDPNQVPISPQEEDQRGIYRYQEYLGYAGDIQHRVVSVPIATEGVDRFSGTAQDHQGVWHEHIGADGSHTIQSAKSITLEKWGLIPAPVQVRDPRDPEGDTLENYRASGVEGDGDENPREDFGFAGRQDAAAHAMLGLELHGFAGDRMGLSNLRAHKRELEVPAENEVELASETGGVYPEYKLDPDVMWMPLPKYRELVVQKGRWEKVRYYASRSAIQQLEDGSIVLEDGYGSQISMSGGNITITCSGDVLLLPGRNAITMAPQDLVLRAGNSADLTASRRDVRLKAERNLELLGANSGQGGVLIESRDQGGEYDFSRAGEGKDIQGLVLRDQEGTIAILSKSLSASGLEGGTTMIQTPGTLVLRGGTSRVEAESSVFVTSGPFADGGALTQFSSSEFSTARIVLGAGSEPPTVAAGSSFAALGSVGLYGATSIAGNLTVDGSGQFNGSVASSSETMTVVGSGARNAITSTVNNTRTAAANLSNRTAEQDQEDRSSVLQLTTETGYFNPDLSLTVAVGGLRTDEDYRTLTTAQFMLPEARWQQFARATGAGKTWVEPEVKTGDVVTAPWPGVRAWSGDARLLQYSEANFSVSDGHSTAGQQEKRATVTTNLQVLSQAYLVNSKE